MSGRFASSGMVGSLSGKASRSHRARRLSSLRPELQGAADQRIPLSRRRGGQGGGFCVSGQRHPVDSGRWQRFVARHPRLKIYPDHHAARRGLSLSFHAATMRQGEASVTLQHIGKAQ